jgi:hypothetical protein
MLATDKCYDTVRSATGDSVQKRTTYVEIATPAQMPTAPCNIHGEPRVPVIADAPAAPATDAPRAELAADLSDVRPVALKAPTLVAENDPYDSAKPIAKIERASEEPIADQQIEQKIDNPEKVGAREEIRSRESNETRTEIRNQTIDRVGSTDAGKPILKAIPVQPQPQQTPVEIRRAVPVGPMDEVEEGALLKAPTPSPAGSDDN